MNDDVLTRNDDGELAVRTVSSTESATVVNPNDVYTRDTDGKLCVRTVGGSGGGGSVDYTKVVSKTKTMPTASSSNENIVYMYMGETNANYTHGYIYGNKKTSEYTGTVSFSPATLSGTVVACSGDVFATFLTEAGADPTPIVSGTMTYEADATGWRIVGKDSNNDTVTTFLEYVEDYEDAGFTFTGTPEDGDVVAFTCTIEESAVTYSWTRIDIQPAGVQINDNSTSLTETWSASKLNTMIGDVETLLSQI